MRNLHDLDAFRDCTPATVEYYGGPGDDRRGAFWVPSPIDRQMMRVVAGTDDGWDHVSVSRMSRCPNWGEMEHVKRLFFRDDETAMQLHVPPACHISNNPNCLHLWRPHKESIPRPPKYMV